jgi:hypothetical protein
MDEVQERYLELWRKIYNNLESEEANKLRDEADVYWRQMTSEQLTEVRAIIRAEALQPKKEEAE